MNELNRTAPLQRYAVAAGVTLTAGMMAAINPAGALVPAADTAGLLFAGIAMPAFGESYCAVNDGIVGVANSATSAITRADRGKVAYVEDAWTVAAAATNKVAAGVIVDVYDDRVYVDCRPAAVAAARAKAETPEIPEIPVLPETGPAIADLALTGTYATWDEVNGAADLAAIVTKLNAVLAALRAADLIAAE